MSPCGEILSLRGWFCERGVSLSYLNVSQPRHTLRKSHGEVQICQVNLPDIVLDMMVFVPLVVELPMVVLLLT